MRPRPRVAAETSGAILEGPVRSRAPVRPTAEAATRPVIAPAHRTAAGIAPLLPTVATTAEAAARPVIAPARHTAAGIAPLLPMVATTAEAAARPVIAPARRPAAADIAPLLLREGAAVVAAVPAAAAEEAPTAGGARRRLARVSHSPTGVCGGENQVFAEHSGGGRVTPAETMLR